MTVNYIKRYISEAGLRASVAITTGVVEEAVERHQLSPLAAAALGRVMTGGLLLANDFKNHEAISIKFKGDGPIGGIYIDAYDTNKVRGYVDHPEIMLPLKNGKLDVGSAVGQGDLIVTRFSHLKTPYTSQSEIISGEIAEDLAFYLFMSEQTGSTISLGVMVEPEGRIRSAGGFFVQALPDVEDDALAIVEENIASIGPITAYLEEHPQGEGLIEKIFAGLPFKVLTEDEVQYQCTCSQNKMEAALLSLPESDRIELLKDNSTEMVCHYCSNHYVWQKSDLEKLFER